MPRPWPMFELSLIKNMAADDDVDVGDVGKEAGLSFVF